MSSRPNRKEILRQQKANADAAVRLSTTRIADIVNVLRDDGSICQQRIGSAPWQMGGHTWVVRLEAFEPGGMRLGAYACERVTAVEKSESGVGA